VCPKQGKGAALILPACNTEAMNLHLAEIAATVTRRPRYPSRRPSRLAHVDTSRRTGQRYHHHAATQMSRAQPGRERVAVHARQRQLAFKPNLQIIRRSRRPLLRGLEQARRSALAHHVPRIAPMGARVLINGTRYKYRRVTLTWRRPDGTLCHHTGKYRGELKAVRRLAKRYGFRVTPLNKK